jgi:hypothetical protein
MISTTRSPCPNSVSLRHEDPGLSLQALRPSLYCPVKAAVCRRPPVAEYQYGPELLSRPSNLQVRETSTTRSARLPMSLYSTTSRSSLQTPMRAPLLPCCPRPASPPPPTQPARLSQSEPSVPRVFPTALVQSRCSGVPIPLTFWRILGFWNCVQHQSTPKRARRVNRLYQFSHPYRCLFLDPRLPHQCAGQMVFFLSIGF